MINNPIEVESSSFRDLDSQVYKINGIIYRQINPSGHLDYQHLMESGLYKALIDKKMVIPHQEVLLDKAYTEQAKTIIQPEQIDFISYCYEWCFSQYKDAALLTLDLVKTALQYGMILKDASAYNIQFHQSRAIFIDTGSFELYQEGAPWVAYGQFCRHFLAPLLLMAKVDVRLGSLMKQYIDGIPLDIASKMLPSWSWASLSTLAHVHIHAKAQKKYNDSGDIAVKKKPKVSKVQLLGMMDNLANLIKRLKLNVQKTEWGDYYKNTNYTDQATLNKTKTIETLVAKTQAKQIWDLGGNNGYYSRVASQSGAKVVCFDLDPLAVEANYQTEKKTKSGLILPLLQDLTNPSYSLGWGQVERCGLRERGPVDLIMALALIHHLALSNNVPLKQIASYFSSLGTYLIIEFVPKIDSQVKRLLLSREDIFHEYDIEHFKEVFSTYFTILEEVSLSDTCRTIFLMKKITHA